MRHKIIFIFLIPFFTLEAKPEATRIDFYYGIAQGNYLIGDLEGAAKGVEQILKLNPDYIPALTLNARILIDQKKTEQALSFIERAIELELHNPEHRLLKALALGNLNRREEAIQVIESVLRSTPEKNRYHRVGSKLLGLFLMAEGNPDEAAEIFNQSYLNNPETAEGNRELAEEAYLQIINDALAQNDFKTALTTTDKALELLQHPTGDALFQRRIQLSVLKAQILTQVGRANEAIETLQTVLRLQPDNLEVLTTLASLCVTMENWSLLQDILPDIAAMPEFQDIALYFEGRIHLENGRVGTAREAFESGLRLLPEGPGGLRTSMQFYLGVCLIQLDRIEAGDAEILRSLAGGFRPETEKELLLASRVSLRNQQVQRAITLLEALTLNRVTDSPEAWNLLGRAHQANGSTALSLSAFNQSLSIQPNQAPTLALRGTILRQLGDFEGALVDIRRALQLAPDDPGLTYSLGLIHFQTGELTIAEHWLAENTQNRSEEPGIHLLHACLAYAIEAYEKAQISLENYLRRVPEKTNESAFYLEYALIAHNDPNRAIQILGQRVETSDADPLLKNFLDYVLGNLDRKALLDAAAYAESPEIARQQLCEATYWLAQHERAHNRNEAARELLGLTIRIGSPDYPEYRFGRWQLETLFSDD